MEPTGAREVSSKYSDSLTVTTRRGGRPIVTACRPASEGDQLRRGGITSMHPLFMPQRHFRGDRNFVAAPGGLGRVTHAPCGVEARALPHRAYRPALVSQQHVDPRRAPRSVCAAPRARG